MEEIAIIRRAQGIDFSSPVSLNFTLTQKEAFEILWRNSTTPYAFK